MALRTKGQGVNGTGAARALRGQGATEYLVLLAVVLVIALVSIALLGFFPGLSTDAKITQSAAYWKAGKPFAIVEHNIVASNGTAFLVMQNMDASSSLTINSVTLQGTGASSGTANVTVGSGESTTYAFNANNTASTRTAGGVYDLTVTINYTSASGMQNSQFGAKTLSGKYS